MARKRASGKPQTRRKPQARGPAPKARKSSAQVEAVAAEPAEPLASTRKQRVVDFAAWCGQHITGDEKGQAQIFLDRLFQAYGQKGVFEAGAVLEMRVKKTDQGGTAFADLVWKPYVLVEMKKRGEDLRRHYRQAFDYWTRLVPNRPHYVVLCNFDEFWIYDFDTQMDEPKDKVRLEQLADRNGALSFLSPIHEKPIFTNDHEAVTRAAADNLADCFSSLIARKVERGLAQRFILQTLVALFAEDIDLLDQYTITRLLDDCKKPGDTYDLLGGLFSAMNEPKGNPGGRYKGVRYFNGGLFADPAHVELKANELELLRQAAGKDWSQVRPEIFGTIFEHSLGKEARHASGAHFTSAGDIMKIVGPTIVEPWREQIEGAKTLKELRTLRDRMQHYHVLDPACGSGNFLYIAYRELKRLEARLFERMDEFKGEAKLGEGRLSFLSAHNFHGMDINPFAVELAKVTMMIARKLAIDELHITEQALPLDNLDENFKACDALITADGLPTPWPQTDVIIGNPPFLDARKMTQEFGREYVSKLEELYPGVPRRADLCTYWIFRTHERLRECRIDDPTCGRAGLVGTQNIRNNQSRVGGLDHVVKDGTIIEAVDNQPWSGEAVVHVSIVNWIKSQSQDLVSRPRRLWFVSEHLDKSGESMPHKGIAGKNYQLDFRECSQINSSLSDECDVSGARTLTVNKTPKRCFEGQQPGHDGFRIGKGDDAILRKLSRESDVVFPYINGRDLLALGAGLVSSRIIDFGSRDLLEASAFPEALKLIRDRVLPSWQKNAQTEKAGTGKEHGEHQGRLKKWWQLKRRRGELLDAIEPTNRYIVCSRHSKRPIFVFLSSNIHPDSSLTCFAFCDDFSFSILQSEVHWVWFATKCSKLKSDFRYTPDSVFDTFPWPQASTKKQIDAVAEAGRAIRKLRDEAVKKLKGGLRALYGTLELPGKNPLKDAHAALDAAVLDAYGFSPRKDLLGQLLALNLEVAQRIEKGEPVVAPGIPPGYPDPKKLVTDDCVRPQ